MKQATGGEGSSDPTAWLLRPFEPSYVGTKRRSSEAKRSIVLDAAAVRRGKTTAFLAFLCDFPRASGGAAV